MGDKASEAAKCEQATSEEAQEAAAWRADARGAPLAGVAAYGMVTSARASEKAKQR